MLGLWHSFNRNFTLWIAFFISVFALYNGIYNYFVSDKHLIFSYEQQINAQLKKDILLAEAYLDNPKGSLPSYCIGLFYNQSRNLVYWSQHSFIPKEEIWKHVQKTRFVYNEKNKYFYAIHKKVKQGHRWVLIPLYVPFPIQNPYLKTFYYGNNVADIFKNTKQIGFKQVNQGINYYDLSDNLLISISFEDVEHLRQGYKLNVLIGLVLVFFFLVHFILKKFHKYWTISKEFIFQVGIISLRFLLLYFHFPYNYVQIELFSSQVLAINELNPSLGDLLLNFMLLTWLTHRWLRLLSLKINSLPCSWSRWTPIIGIHILMSLGIWYLFYYFFFLFKEFIENSQVYFEFTDIFEINFYSALLIINQSLGLAFLYFVIQLFIHLSILLWKNKQFRFQYELLWVGYVIINLVFFAILATPHNDFFDEKNVFALIFFVSFLYYLKYHPPKTTFLYDLLTITALAAVLNLALSRSFEKSTRANLQKTHRIFSDPRDHFMEFTFDSFVEEIANYPDLKNASIRDKHEKNLLQLLTTNYLIPQFKSYDFKVFIYNFKGQRIDNQRDITPFETDHIETTHSKHLMFAINKRNLHQYIYLAKFSIFNNEQGLINIEIEFYPKMNLEQKLYPQLLLDETIKQKTRLPSGYQLGIYYKNILINKIGNSDFPLFINQDILLKEILTNKEFILYYEKLSEERTLILKAPARTFFSKLTTFTILFYIFSLIYFIIKIPQSFIKWSWIELKQKYSSLAFRVQLYFLMVSLLPIIIFSLLITPLFSNFFETQIQNDLKIELKHIAKHIENKIFSHTIAPSEQFISYDLFNYYADLLNSDLNIYNKQGKMIITTLPRLFQSEIISDYMNPKVFQNFQQGFHSELIYNENIGNLEYLSGYTPIINNNYRIIGYLNIPYLAKQDLLNQQIRKFIAYLINLYIVLILVTILFGFFTSRTISKPLTLLKEKLSRLDLEKSNEAIEWKSSDEIGQLIQSYNEMVMQLEESRNLLAKAERETAWQTMARQVAHEIKNPLTPMKLSIQMLLKKAKDHSLTTEQLQKTAHTLITQIDLLTHIANSFSTFAKMPEPRKENLCANDLLLELQPLYEETPVQWLIPDERLWIHADKEQITRVIINLVKNALQALKPNKEGSVIVQLSADEQNTCISVHDNGTGIPLEIQPKIFEPNFSTKSSGMGLGLAICKNIVQVHDGTLNFHSEPDAGTTFTMKLPRLHIP